MIRQVLVVAALAGATILSGCGGGAANNAGAGGAAVTTTLTLTNGSGQTVYKVDATVHGSTAWRTNIIPGMRDLAPSANLQFSFSHADGECVWDFLVYPTTGGPEHIDNQNICQQAEVYYRGPPR